MLGGSGAEDAGLGSGWRLKGCVGRDKRVLIVCLVKDDSEALE